jgi:pimeloyl-ACP methyl ester carboxylesterase
MVIRVVVLVFFSTFTTICFDINLRNNCDVWQRPFEVDESIFPFESKCISLTYGRIHYIDVQPVHMKPLGTILAFHGNPLWSIIFAKLASKALFNGYRFLALDYYGYGMSDKPDPTLFDYKIRSQAKMSSEFIRKLNLTDVVILVQDGGGPIGLGAAQEEFSRIKAFIIGNTWFTETKPILDGTTNENFIFHDWSMDNIINERYFLSTGYNSFNGASGTVKAWKLDPNSTEAKSLTRMILAPYFDNGDASKPLSNTVHLPHVRLVQSVLLERDYYSNIEKNMMRIISKPVYLLFADPLAFSALRCDAGPRTRIVLNTTDAIKFGAKQLSGIRAPCPTSFVCSDNLPKPFQSKCLDKQGKEYWHALESVLRIWPKDKIVGIYKNFPGHEYLSASEPDQFMIAIQTLHNFTLTNNGYQHHRWHNIFYYILLLLIFKSTISSK